MRASDIRLLGHSRPLVYIAAPLFSAAEIAYNLELARILEMHVDVFLPQRDGGKLVDLISRGVEIGAASNSIFQRDIEAIRECDALLLVLDGRAIDEGAAFELGFAFAHGKHCVGLQTDPRRLLPIGNNPMIQVPLAQIFSTTDEMAGWARTIKAAAGVSLNTAGGSGC